MLCFTLIKYSYRHAPVTKHKQIQAGGEHRKQLQGQAGKLNKNKWLIETKNTYAFFLSFPSSRAAASLHLFLPYALLLWWISPKQIRDAEESLSFLTPLSPLLISPFLSTPLCFFGSPVFLSLSLYPISLSTFPSSPLPMWISFSLIMMIWGSASVAGPLKPSSSSSSSSKPCLSLYCRQTAKQSHKMASTLHTAL